MATTDRVIAEDAIRVLDHGFVRLDGAMATDLSVVNAARVSFARRKAEMDEADEGLIRFLMRDRHGTPFEHNSFRFHIRAPIFVAREWFRHRVGCLTGDTVVTFVDTNSHANRALSKTIDDLWRMWTVGEKNGHALAPEVAAEVDRPAASGERIRAMSRSLGIGRRAVRSQLGGRDGHRDSRWRVRKMRLRVLDESTGEFVTSHIADIFEKGVQPVYRLTLADGKQLTLTTNHRVLTDEGWKTIGQAIGLRGEREQARMTRSCALMVNGVPVHQDRTWLRSRREAGRSVGEISSRTRGWKLTAHAVAVVAIDYIGLRQTYDLSIAGPWPNFVANGVVVHNSFNEFSMRYAKATDDFYVPEAEDVRSQVGKPGAYSFEPVSDELAEQTREELQAVYDTAYETYERLVEAGVARELARSVMPVGSYTEFFWTVNARALMNFVSLRAADTAQREIRYYADAVEQFFAQKMPVTHAAFVAAGRVAP